MRYSIFFQIEIIHPYFSDKLADLIVLPNTETRELLNSQHFLVKRTVNGIQVLIKVNEEGVNTSLLGENEVFVFYVFPTVGNIREFTDTTTLENGKMILFTNEALDLGNLELTKSETLKEGQYQGFQAIAKVEIKSREITSKSNGLGALYRAVFKSKAIKWTYYFVSDSTATDIAIETRDRQLKFNKLEVKDDKPDKIVSSLMLNSQDIQVFVFESSVAIPYSNKPIKDIKLMQNGVVLIKHLPNPAVQDQGIQIIKIK